MSFLDPIVIDPVTQAVNQIKVLIRQMYAQLARTGLQGYGLIWQNPDATPHQIIEALGTDAVKIFQLAGLNIQTLQAAASIGGTTSPTVPTVPSQYILTPNEDGSMTLTDVATSGTSGDSGSSGSSGTDSIRRTQWIGPMPGSGYSGYSGINGKVTSGL